MSRPKIVAASDDLVLTARERELIKNFRRVRPYSQETLVSVTQGFAERDSATRSVAMAPSLKLVSGGAA